MQPRVSPYVPSSDGRYAIMAIPITRSFLRFAWTNARKTVALLSRIHRVFPESPGPPLYLPPSSSRWHPSRTTLSAIAPPEAEALALSPRYRVPLTQPLLSSAADALRTSSNLRWRRAHCLAVGPDLYGPCCICVRLLRWQRCCERDTCSLLLRSLTRHWTSQAPGAIACPPAHLSTRCVRALAGACHILCIVYGSAAGSRR